MEEYKQIPGYENYGISPAGEVKNLKTGKILKLTNNGKYFHVNLYTDSTTSKILLVHKLMAITYMNHTPDGTSKIVVDHINNDRYDNRLTNLQLITQRLNVSKDRNRLLPTGVNKTPSGKYNAYIRIGKYDKLNNRRSKYLGTFDTPEEAHQAYLAAIPQ